MSHSEGAAPPFYAGLNRVQASQIHRTMEEFLAKAVEQIQAEKS